MIGLLQRVTQARVDIDGDTVASIAAGLLVLVAVERGDSGLKCKQLLERLLDYRVFADEQGRMNQSLRVTRGGLLLVPQFTLAADTNKGLRPGFSRAAPPDEARDLFDRLLDQAQAEHVDVAAGRFGADMQVALVNDGPVTFWLQV